MNILFQNLILDKTYGKQISSKKKDNLNPVYGETFNFEIPSTLGLHNMVLTCKVMDDDILMDDQIGKCKIKLDELALSSTPLGIDRVVDNNWFTKDARIYLQLSYKFLKAGITTNRNSKTITFHVYTIWLQPLAFVPSPKDTYTQH